MIRTLFTWIPFVVGLTIMVGLIFPRCRQLQLRTRTQAVWAMVLLFCCSKFLAFKALGGDEFNPDLPTVVIWIWDWLYSGAMLMAALMVLTVFFRFRAKLWILPIVAWGMSAVGLYNGFSVPSVKEIELSYSDLPPSLEGYRIVQLSDLHCSSAARRWRTEAIVEKVNALNADLICLTGDLADGSVDKIGPYLEPIGRLRARDGVFACTGNHEYYHDYFAWKGLFYEKLDNIRFLANECVFPREGLALAGVPDEIGMIRCGLSSEREWWQSYDSATNGEFRVMMVHQPKDVTMYVRECDVRLQLSGHTHGGIAPILSTLVKAFNGGFVRGLYPAPGRTGDRYLYVSPGCGQWAGFPMRFFNDSEITVFKLKRVNSK